MNKGVRDLEVWQLAIATVEEIYALSRSFPADERFGLTAQIRRAAVSVPSALAEGHERYSTKDYARFVAIAAGSAAEVETQLVIAARLGFVDEARIAAAMDLTTRTAQMLRKLRMALDRRITRPSADASEARGPRPE